MCVRAQVCEFGREERSGSSTCSAAIAAKNRKEKLWQGQQETKSNRACRGSRIE
jgi:hypothetical protein